MSRHGQTGKRSKSCGGVWKYFLYNARRDKASCAVDFCTTIISGKKTANLRRHLQNKHPVIYAMLPCDDGTSKKETSDPASVPVTCTVAYNMKRKFKKKLSSIMDSYLKSTVSEVTKAFEAFTFDHELMLKEQIEECAMLRLKLKKAEKKIKKQNQMRGQREDVTHASEQRLPELTVDVPDDWCAPLGCDNIADQTPSTSYEATGSHNSSLCSLSVSLWRLPDIKQEVQDDGYQLDNHSSGPYLDESPQRNLKHTKGQKKSLSATQHSRPRSAKAAQSLNGSMKPKPGQPVHAAQRSNEKLPEKGRGKKRDIQAFKLEPEPMEEKIDSQIYRCKFCSEVFDTEFRRTVHLRSHKKCTGCQKMFQYPSYLRIHMRTCAKLQSAANSTDIDGSLCLRKGKMLSPGEHTSISPIPTQHSERKQRAKKRSTNTDDFLRRDKFPCTNCHKSFCSIVWLKNHISKHSTCTICSKIFCSKYFLRRHIYKVHTQSPDEKPPITVDSELPAISSKERLSELGAVPSKEKPSELVAVPSKKKRKLGAVPSNEKPSKEGAVLSKENLSELGAVPSKEKPSEVGVVPSKEKLSELGAVPFKEKPSEVGAVPFNEKLSELGADPYKEKLGELGAVPSKEKHGELGADPYKEKLGELGADPSNEKHGELGAVPSKKESIKWGSLSSEEKHMELGAVPANKKQIELGAVSPNVKQSSVDDNKNMLGSGPVSVSGAAGVVPVGLVMGVVVTNQDQSTSSWGPS